MFTLKTRGLPALDLYEMEMQYKSTSCKVELFHISAKDNQRHACYTMDNSTSWCRWLSDLEHLKFQNGYVNVDVGDPDGKQYHLRYSIEKKVSIRKLHE